MDVDPCPVSQRLPALFLPSNTFLHPCPVPAGSPPASQSPGYFQLKAGGAQINRKQVGSGFHPQGSGQRGQTKGLDKGGKQQRKTMQQAPATQLLL